MTKSPESKFKKLWKSIGPGVITGASDDDPSGIATYSQAGAKFGTKLLWTSIFTFPLMAAIQEMCARIGLVTNKGLAGVIKSNYPKPVLYLILFISIPSIILNIAADLAGMGAVCNLIFPAIPGFAFSILFTGLILLFTIKLNYNKLATVLKWLCITLGGYIIIPFLTRTEWSKVFMDTFWPTIQWNTDYLLALVGILGTTISPYLFVWQTSMEVEERETLLKKKLTGSVLGNMRTDITSGMFYSNLIMFFIVLTTGTVLFNSGIHNINTVEEAAKALQPLAGNLAYALFAIGVIGTGLLAIPVLGGSLSYMVAEAFSWEEGMNKKFHEAKGFYLTLIVSLCIGLIILFTGIDPIKALIYTAVLYGLIAPLMIALIIHICNKKQIMGQHTNGKWSNFLGIITLLLMSFSAIALVWSYFL